MTTWQLVGDASASVLPSKFTAYAVTQLLKKNSASCSFAFRKRFTWFNGSDTCRDTVKSRVRSSELTYVQNLWEVLENFCFLPESPPHTDWLMTVSCIHHSSSFLSFQTTSNDFDCGFECSYIKVYFNNIHIVLLLILLMDCFSNVFQVLLYAAILFNKGLPITTACSISLDMII